MRTATAVIALMACVTFSGCSAPDRRVYWRRRGRDLADCVKAEIGWAGPQMGGIHARVKATDFAVLGCGVNFISTRYGWRGRYGAPGYSHTWAIGLPLLGNVEYGDDSNVDTQLWCITTREYEKGDPGPRGRIAERFWCGVSADLFLSARLDLNPAEFADFLAGAVGWDMLADDDWQPTQEE